jgi:integrase
VGQSKYLLERYKGRDITELCSKSIYLDYTEWRRKYYQSHETKRKQKYKRYNKDVEGREYLTVGNVRINREIRLLVSILRFAKEYKNVLQDINIPQYTMLEEKRRDALLTQEEYLKLEKHWMNKNPYYWKIISFLNNTGLRYPSELNKIVWSDIDLEKSYVLIRDRKNKNRNNVLDTAVPLVGTARTIIEELKAREKISKGETDFVFVNDKGMQIKSINRAFKKSLVECDIDKKKLTMYSLRHLFTTRMIRRADIAPKVLATVLGHRDLTMIDKHYSHFKVEDLVNVFQRSEDHKQEILNGRKQDQTDTTLDDAK